MELLQFTIAGLETKRFERAGRYLEVIAADARITIDLTGRDGEQVGEMRQALAGFYHEEPYSGFEVRNEETYAQTVTLMIATGRGGSRRAAGVFEVVDTSRRKVAAGNCFRGVASLTATGTAFPRVQVYNPAGSGKVLFITRARIGTSIGGAWFVGTSSTILSTLIGPALNLDRNLPGSVGIMRTQELATLGGSELVMATGFVQNQADAVEVFANPIMVRPGFGAVFSEGNNTNGLQLNVTVEFEEWPI